MKALLFLLILAAGLFPKSSYEYRFDGPAGDSALYSTSNRFLALKEAPPFQYSPAFSANLADRLHESGTYFRLTKHFRLQRSNCFRINFAMQNLDAGQAKKASVYVDSLLEIDFLIMARDDFRKAPNQPFLFKCMLIPEGEDFRMAYLVPQKGGQFIRVPSVILEQGSPFCLESRLTISPDSMADSLEFRINGETSLRLDLSGFKISIPDQFYSFGNVYPRILLPGRLYFDDLAFDSVWPGSLPLRPVISAADSASSFFGGDTLCLAVPGYVNTVAGNDRKASQFQVRLPGFPDLLPLFDSGPDSSSREFFRARIPLDPAGRYLWKVRHFSANGNASDWSPEAELRPRQDGIAPPRPRILSAFHAQPGKRKPLKAFRAGDWVDFLIRYKPDSVTRDLGYCIFWCSNESYALGSPINRGGLFLERSSYVYNFSHDPTTAYEKGIENSYKTYTVYGRQGIYVDASQGLYQWDSLKGEVRCRVRFLAQALPGLWSLRGIIRNGNERSSWLFFDTLRVLPPGGAIRRPLTDRLRVAGPVLLGLLMLAAVFFFLRKGKGEARDVTRFRQEESFRQFEAFVRANLSRPIEREDIEKEMPLSYENLYRIVKVVTGQSLKGYVLKAKIDEAGRLLSTTSRSVKEIMQAVGFQDQAHFTKIFKKYSGSTPTEFQRKGR